MSVTTEFAPASARTVPARRPVAPARRTAATVRSRVTAGAPSCVAGVRAGAPIAATSAVQLTRRGWVLLLAVATAVAAVLVWIAFLSHPAPTAATSAAAPTQVVVQSGDTLWSIAGRIAPDRDPRAVVYELQQANHLSDPTVTVGQVLRVV